MLTNKYLQATLSAGVALFGWAAAFDWTSIVTPQHAAAIAGAIGTAKLLMNFAAPGPHAAVQPTGGVLVTHKIVAK